ncbi:MAG: helix-turn-helix domain-containing protein [Victivallales bacterium]|nr:helix-turn-helix domain-containing protein [Victivallales bacterium]
MTDIITVEIPRLLTGNQACALLGIHRNTLRRWERSGLITPIKYNVNCYRYRADEVAALACGEVRTWDLKENENAPR